MIKNEWKNIKNEWKNIKQPSGIEPGSPEDQKLPFEQHPWKTAVEYPQYFVYLPSVFTFNSYIDPNLQQKSQKTLAFFDLQGQS